MAWRNAGSGYSGADPLTDQAAKAGVRLQAAPAGLGDEAPHIAAVLVKKKEQELKDARQQAAGAGSADPQTQANVTAGVQLAQAELTRLKAVEELPPTRLSMMVLGGTKPSVP